MIYGLVHHDSVVRDVSQDGTPCYVVIHRIPTAARWCKYYKTDETKGNKTSSAVGNDSTS